MSNKSFVYIIIFMVLMVVCQLSFCNEATTVILDSNKIENSNQPNSYESEKISFEIKKRFSKFYTSDVKDFYFYQDGKELSFTEFVEISQDPIFKKNNAMLKRIKISGIFAGTLFGVAMVASIIPSAILINNALSYNMIDADKYLISGIVTTVLAIASGIGLIIDIIVAVAMYQRYRFNENIIRSAVDSYNKKLREKYHILPDITFNSDNDINLIFKIKI